jgi:beta-aspartyl-peptidase (threonine type)
MKSFRVIAVAVLWTACDPSLAAVAAEDVAKEVHAILTQQADSWNRGDIGAFMEHYWKSDDLTFSSGGQTTRGWQSTKENYQRRYPTREKMGRLTFSQLEITPLGESAALVLGRWQLARDESPVGGNFSLVCRKIDGKWLIIHDHTSKTD